MIELDACCCNYTTKEWLTGDIEPRDCDLCKTQQHKACEEELFKKYIQEKGISSDLPC